MGRHEVGLNLSELETGQKYIRTQETALLERHINGPERKLLKTTNPLETMVP